MNHPHTGTVGCGALEQPTGSRAACFPWCVGASRFRVKHDLASLLWTASTSVVDFETFKDWKGDQVVCRVRRPVHYYMVYIPQTGIGHPPHLAFFLVFFFFLPLSNTPLVVFASRHLLPVIGRSRCVSSSSINFHRPTSLCLSMGVCRRE